MLRTFVAVVLSALLAGCSNDESGRNAPAVVEACSMAERDAAKAEDLAAMKEWATKGLAGGSKSEGAPRDINREATTLALALTTGSSPSPDVTIIQALQKRLAAACTN